MTSSKTDCINCTLEVLLYHQAKGQKYQSQVILIKDGQRPVRAEERELHQPNVE